MSEPVIGHDQKHDGIAPVFDWRDVCLVCTLVRERDTERARVAVLSRALVEAVMPLEVIAGQHRMKPYRELSPDFIDSINAAIEQARTALAVLPVDRVGVEPLDVERLYKVIRRIAMREDHPGHHDLRSGLTTPGLGHGYEVTLAGAIAEEYDRGA